LEFAKGIERKYISLGGKIHFNSKVAKVIVEDNRAVGIRLSDGSENKADFVISAADGHSTIFDFLDGKYIDNQTKQYYDAAKVFDPLVYVSLGVALDLSKEPMHLRFKTKKPIQIDTTIHETVGCTNYSFDPTLAPECKTVLVSMFPSNYEYWKRIVENRRQYDQEKERIAQELIAALETRFPGLTQKVEVIDVATPLTFERYTGNWRGAYEGWLPTTDNYGKTLKKTLPDLRNFYIIGQWTMPGGGIPTGIITARKVIETISKLEKKKFVTD
jgi:phytoene dehydrogenase-like protein